MKTVLKIFCVFLAMIILLAGGFVGYLEFSYYRIGDTPLTVGNNQESYVTLGEEYSITTYNIGFGAYDREYSFFMDTGYMADGSKTVGKYGNATSKEAVLRNTNGSIAILTALDSDFLILEEVDTDSTRSYHVNQRDAILSALGGLSYTYASNFHSAFLPYPIHDMHGIANSGILTMSKFKMESAERRELPIDASFVNKFFDLDRCIALTRYRISGSDKQLTVISVHLSAYDEGGVIRREQIALLSELMRAEYETGNYVIVGGDFNHDIAEGGSRFPTAQLRPDWIQALGGDEFGEGFRIACDSSAPTCRDADIPWEEGVTFASVIDGFIVSDNVKVMHVSTVTAVEGSDTNFMYSDHNPVTLRFVLSEE